MTTPIKLIPSVRRAVQPIAAFLLLAITCLAQPAGTGTVEGRVQNIVTGRYLNNARVSVKQTDILTLTDESGNYRISRVPSGPIVLEVFYTGLDPQHIPITVSAGQTITRDVSLTNVALYGAPDATVRLDPLTVAATRETDGAVIAINEQRFAPNIKNVVSTEAHGEVMGGNLGQFLKYIPGVMEDVGGFEPEGILVRGFPTNLTVMTSDGAPLANGGGSRSFTLEQISINNVSRVEVTKVPTPATGADSMAGSVNMVSKSAFERAGSQLRYNVNMTANGEALTLQKKADPFEETKYRIVPGFSFDYTLPINKNLGIVLTAMHFQAFVPQVFANKTFTVTGTSTGASIAKPFLQTFQLQDSPQTRVRNSGSARVDWRVTPKSVLSAGVQSSYYEQVSANYNFNAGTGNNGTPTVAGGVPFSYGDDFTIGATGRGTVSQTAGFNIRYQSLAAGDIRYRFDDGDWKIDALVAKSLGKSWTRSIERGFFAGLTTAPKVPIRVTFRDINDIGPGTAEAFTNTNQRFDIYDINNYNITGATSSTNDRRDGMLAGHLNVKRALDFMPFPTSVQVGGARKENWREQINGNLSFTYNGINGDLSAPPYAARVYVGQKLANISSVERNNGGKSPPYASLHRAWEANKQNPALFTQTPAQVVTAARNVATTDIYFKETVDALYLQTEMRLIKNRLNLLTGVRYEKTTDHGEGPITDPDGVWVRNANGSFARTATGALIRRPEAGAVGSLQEVPFIAKRRAYQANRSYDGYYPSLHLTFNVTEKFLARLAYAKTYGRPNYGEIIPTTTIDENELGNLDDPSVVKGTISVRNTGLRPWTADNYDLSLEYYTDSGGLFGASVFHKEIKDFFATFAKVATVAELGALGLGSEYAGWQVNTRINAGDARVSGVELSMNHSLSPLGKWGQYFRVFANATKLELKGNRGADFSGFLPKTLNWGVTYSKKPIILMAKWNWRDRQQTTPFATFGPDAYNYLDSLIHLDMNLDYQLRKNVSLYFNGRNVFNVPPVTLRYGSQTPEYAKVGQTKNYGAIYSIGVKGTF
ncbi:MAG: TonB-dependent receptor [Verrucomicrobia bacterium]|nr:TonB-dependent receptor [Verrucomicrobiota bacterium]